MTHHLSSVFFCSNQLAAWYISLRCGLSALKVLGSSPKQARKEEQKIKILRGDKKSESNFARIQSGINNQNFGPEICAWFWETETSGFAKNMRNHARSFGWAETGEILEVSGEKKLLCMGGTLRSLQFWCRQICSTVKFAQQNLRFYLSQTVFVWEVP
jgi:hypothetical protein